MQGLTFTTAPVPLDIITEVQDLISLIRHKVAATNEGPPPAEAPQAPSVDVPGGPCLQAPGGTAPATAACIPQAMNPSPCPPAEGSWHSPPLQKPPGCSEWYEWDDYQGSWACLLCGKLASDDHLTSIGHVRRVAAVGAQALGLPEIA